MDSDTLKALARLPPRDDRWNPVLQVQVEPGAPPVIGRYAVSGGAVRFIPDVPLQSGRPYRVILKGQVRTLTPQGSAAPAARVIQAYPSGGVVPQNLLRLYVQFSAPMMVGRPGSLSLLDAHGHALDEPFLPLGYEFWSPDRTRLTVLLDPGRVKRGILRQPVLTAGERYTLVVGRDWRDAKGATLAADYRQAFVAGPPERRAIDPAGWRLSTPRAGSREPLRLAFGRPLDRALLMSAVGIEGPDGALLQVIARPGPSEADLAFVPQRPWTAGAYRLIAQPFLEDPAGNRPGRPFEDGPGLAVRPAKPGLIAIPFSIRP